MTHANIAVSRGSSSARADRIEIPPPPPPQPRRWRRAPRAPRALPASPDATEHAIDFMYSLGSRDYERHFQRFAASARGRSLLAERPSLLAALSDRAELARMPEGSLGRAYLEYFESNGSSRAACSRSTTACRRAGSGTRALLGSIRCAAGTGSQHPRPRSLPRAHGYPTDDVGEATLLAFSLAQFDGLAQRCSPSGCLRLHARARLELSPIRLPGLAARAPSGFPGGASLGGAAPAAARHRAATGRRDRRRRGAPGRDPARTNRAPRRAVGWSQGIGWRGR